MSFIVEFTTEELESVAGITMATDIANIISHDNREGIETTLQRI